MMRPGSGVAVYLCVAPVDFRMQINGLAALVQERLGEDPFAAQLYAFINARRTAVKCLYWESSGFVLWHKRLERERFHWPSAESDRVRLNGQELNWLLDGFDLRYWRPHQALRCRYVS
jgi:transposase